MAKAVRKLTQTLRQFRDAADFPRIGLGMDLASTDHFLLRASQMVSQGMQRQEIADALKAPLEVKHNPANGRYYFCGRRVAVVACIDPDGTAVFITVLWASDRLWDLNPRPEREAA